MNYGNSNEICCSQTSSFWIKICVFTRVPIPNWFVQKRDPLKLINEEAVDCGEMSNYPLEINVKCIFLNIFINHIRSQVNNILVKYPDDAKCRSLYKCMSYYGKEAEIPTELWKMHKKQKKLNKFSRFTLEKIA